MLFTFSLCPAKLISASQFLHLYIRSIFPQSFSQSLSCWTRFSTSFLYTLYIRQIPFPNPCPVNFISAPIYTVSNLPKPTNQKKFLIISQFPILNQTSATSQDSLHYKQNPRKIRFESCSIKKTSKNFSALTSCYQWVKKKAKKRLKIKW